jgi:hypothetical protein
MARRIRYIYGQVKSGGVTSVIAPDETGGRMEMTSKSDMERAIMAENESKYHQVSQTPFMLPPLVHNFGTLALAPMQMQSSKASTTFPLKLTHTPQSLSSSSRWHP